MDFLRIVAGVTTTCAHVASREEALDPGRSRSFDPKELLVALIGYWSRLLLWPSNASTSASFSK